MNQISWAAVLASTFALIAFVCAATQVFEQGVIAGLIAITFALLSHRDE